jgi:Lrp/AsnC family transcriptional regulator, regulator of ectoine-degradation genes
MLKLDPVDLRILAALQRDGRITKLALAQEVGLSSAACWERLRRLESSGAIAGYTARIDGAKLARFVTILVEITLKSHRQADFARFEAEIRREPAVVSCEAVGGGVDYVMRIVTTDIATYQALIDDWLSRDVGIARYFTYVVTKTVKEAGFPLDLLRPG